MSKTKYIYSQNQMLKKLKIGQPKFKELIETHTHLALRGKRVNGRLKWSEEDLKEFKLSLENYQPGTNSSWIGTFSMKLNDDPVEQLFDTPTLPKRKFKMGQKLYGIHKHTPAPGNEIYQLKNTKYSISEFTPSGWNYGNDGYTYNDGNLKANEDGLFTTLAKAEMQIAQEIENDKLEIQRLEQILANIETEAEVRQALANKNKLRWPHKIAIVVLLIMLATGFISLKVFKII